MLNITIRMNAGQNTVKVDDVVFDRTSMNGGEKAKLRRMIVAAYESKQKESR